jgi:protocatechuate 4,5-dioxygenase alpha chain
MGRNWAQAIPTQEAYWIDRVLFDTQHQPDAMARFRADPQAYMAALPIAESAKAALIDLDIGGLYLAGANPYLLRAHCLGLGVPEAQYLAALRAVETESARG